MRIITLDMLSKAIENRIDRDGYSSENARRDANFVLDLFGYEKRIIDNMLEPEERQLFYILEEEGMLVTGREETTLHDGKSWLTHYWELKGYTIYKYSLEPKPKVKETENAEENVYDILSNEIWCRTPKLII